MGDREISVIWTSDSNIWRVNKSYIVGKKWLHQKVTLIHFLWFVALFLDVSFRLHFAVWL